MGKFIIRKARRGLYFELLARNHEPIATSELHPSIAACHKAVNAVVRCAANAKVEDLTRGDSSTQKGPKFQVFRDHSDFFRFRLVDKNGGQMLSSEAYKAKASCLNGVKSVVKNCAEAEIYIED